MTLEIARWEFLRFFKPRDLFVTIVLLVATFAIGSLVFGWLVGPDVGGARIAVVAPAVAAPIGGDAAPGDEVVAALVALGAAEDAVTAPFAFHAMAAPEAEAALDAGEIDGVLRPLPAGAAELRAPEQPAWLAPLGEVLTAVAVPLRLERAGMHPDAAGEALAPVALEFVPAGPAPRAGGGVAIMLVLMLFAIFTGTGILFTVITGEKTLRVTELVVSSVSPQTWIDGKIFGTSAYVLVYLLTYTIGLVLAFGAVGLVGGRLPTLPPVVTDPTLFIVTLAFVVLGFGLWFTIFAAIAATVSDPATSARGSFIMLPGGAISIGFLGMLGDANGLFFRIVSYVPFTSPSAMPVRLLIGSVAWWEVAISLALLAASVALVRRAAGRVFALGILMTGKEPTLAEMARWARRVSG